MLSKIWFPQIHLVYNLLACFSVPPLKQFSLYPLICAAFLASSKFHNISLHLLSVSSLVGTCAHISLSHRSALHLGATYLWNPQRLDKWMDGWKNWWVCTVQRKIKWKLIAKAKTACLHLPCVMWGLTHKLELKTDGWLHTLAGLVGFLSLLT